MKRNLLAKVERALSAPLEIEHEEDLVVEDEDDRDPAVSIATYVASFDAALRRSIPDSSVAFMLVDLAVRTYRSCLERTEIVAGLVENAHLKEADQIDRMRGRDVKLLIAVLDALERTGRVTRPRVTVTATVSTRADGPGMP